MLCAIVAILLMEKLFNAIEITLKCVSNVPHSSGVVRAADVETCPPSKTTKRFKFVAANG
jgi:hypothetical protein